VPWNAALQWIPHLPRPTLRRLAGRWRAGDLGAAVGERFALDLAGLLNRLRRTELEGLAAALGVETDGHIGQLRARLWIAGAAFESAGEPVLGTAVQPTPIVLGGRLRFQRRGRGQAPPSPSWPRPVPEAAAPPVDPAEPESLEDLLAAATDLIGVRLGRRGRDKGAHGTRIAALLGVPERGESEPDWRGEVEIKTVPVVRDPSSGLWRVKEDPAVSMEHASPLAKLEQVLWMIVVADHLEFPVLSWYYHRRDERIDALIARDLHTRPKGPAGATTLGWYLHKRFFLDSGLLASLNG
jgi:hypothetical protein